MDSATHPRTIQRSIATQGCVTKDVVGALNLIKGEIQNVYEYVASTAAAVEEQSTVTGEMSGSVQQKKPQA